jgi:crotonobetainyl-CoA:carnitine CoA-transferase CaiB-like acyl-CoA transferase
MELVETWTRERPRAQCLQALEAAGVPCAPYREPGDALADAHLQARGLYTRVSDAAGAFTGVNPPWQMSGSRSRLRDEVPAIGAHADAVLHDWLGVPPSELRRIADHGAFGSAA